MSKNLKLQLSLTAKDKASAAVKQLAKTIEKSEKNISDIKKRGQKQQQAALKRGMTAQAQANRARERLGVRSERQIQREIQRTQASYNRLARSGKASANELSRAYGKMTNKVKGLNQELGRVSKTQKMMGRAKIGAGVVAGVGAGLAVGARMIAEPAKKQMIYDRQLAHVANTSFSDRDVEGRIAGKQELDAAIKKAVLNGGGTKEQALEALDTLLASGTVKKDSAMNLLPTLQKASMATGASTQDLSKIAISAMQQLGIKEQDIGKVLDRAVAAGQAGNFELTDMARWLPAQMAAAVSAGMSGMAGFDALLVANQQARVTAGSSDQAGNNLVNLLAKLTSKETNDRLAKTKYKGADGIDFISSMEKAKKEGKDPIQSFVGIIDKIVGADSRYQKLQSQLKTAKDTDKARIAEEMIKLMEGSAIGKIISDRQALMALVGIRNNQSLGADVKQQISKSHGAVDKSYKVIADTNDFKTQQLGNVKDFAQMDSIKRFNDILGDVSEKLVTYSKEYPKLTEYISSASDLIKSLGTAAAVAALSVWAMSGFRGGIKVGNRGIPPISTKPANTAAPAASASRALKLGKLANIASKLAKIARIASPAGLAMAMLSIKPSDSKPIGNAYAAAYAAKRNNPAYKGDSKPMGNAYAAAYAAKRKNPAYKGDSKPMGNAYAAAYAAKRNNPAYKGDSDSDWVKASQGMSDSYAKAYVAQVTEQIANPMAKMATDFNNTSQITTQAMQAMANREVSVNTTNQIFLDGSQIAEQVTTQQGKMLDRGGL